MTVVDDIPKPVERTKKHADFLLLWVLYTISYVFVIGPWIGSMTSWDNSIWELLPEDIGLSLALITNPRGIIYIVGYMALLILYVFIRARLAGQSVNEYAEARGEFLEQ